MDMAMKTKTVKMNVKATIIGETVDEEKRSSKCECELYVQLQ